MTFADALKQTQRDEERWMDVWIDCMETREFQPDIAFAETQLYRAHRRRKYFEAIVADKT